MLSLGYFLIAAFVFLVIMRLAGHVLAGMIRLVVLCALVILGLFLVLPALDFSWSKSLWKAIEVPVYGILGLVALWSAWTMFDRLHLWWQHTHRPVYRYGKDMERGDVGVWAVERREKFGWIEVRAGIETQEHAIEWIKKEQDEWSKLRASPFATKKGRAYARKIFK